MSDISGQEFARQNPQEVTFSQRMDLNKAYNILQAITDFREESITDDSSLDKIGDYSTESIRQALKLTGEDLLSKHRVHSIENMSKWLSKGPQKGRLQLNFEYGPKGRDATKEDEEFSVDDNIFDTMKAIKLELVDYYDPNWKGLTEFKFPLIDPETELQSVLNQFRVGFHDNRDEDGKDVSLSDMTTNFNLSDYRFMVQGLKWLSANMLSWKDKKIIMPEKLTNDLIEPSNKHLLQKSHTAETSIEQLPKAPESIVKRMEAELESAKKDLDIGDYESAGKRLRSIRETVLITASRIRIVDAINEILPENERVEKRILDIDLPPEYYALLGKSHKFSFLDVCGVDTSFVKTEELDRKISTIMSFVPNETANLLRDRFGLNPNNNYESLTFEKVAKKYGIENSSRARLKEAKALKFIRIKQGYPR
jgi:hypothetical protein